MTETTIIGFLDFLGVFFVGLSLFFQHWHCAISQHFHHFAPLCRIQRLMTLTQRGNLVFQEAVILEDSGEDTLDTSLPRTGVKDHSISGYSRPSPILIAFACSCPRLWPPWAAACAAASPRRRREARVGSARARVGTRCGAVLDLPATWRVLGRTSQSFFSGLACITIPN